VRIFVDESPVIASLAAGLIARERRSGQGSRTLLLDHLRLVQRAALRAGPGKESASTSVDRLTDREREVLRMIALGKRNQEIAHELVVTLDTVKKHATHVFEKLGVASRTQAVTEARKLGLVE
jgi:LuxR family maltose regulon positive regulatory protein